MAKHRKALKVFKLYWRDGTYGFNAGKDYLEAYENCDSSHRGSLDHFEEVPVKTMTQIAAEVGLPVKTVIHMFRGLMGSPELRKKTPDMEKPDLLEFWTEDPTRNLLADEHAQEFMVRIKSHMAQAAQ
jgi:hypothetical protein